MPIITPGGGGGGSYVAPVTRETVRGNVPSGQVVIPNGDTLPLIWDQKLSGDDLLNLTAPTAPTVVTAGVYSFACTVQADTALTAGGAFFASLELDALGDDVAITALSAQATAAFGRPPINLNLVWYCPAGAQVLLTVENDDGAAARTFRLIVADIQRVS